MNGTQRDSVPPRVDVRPYRGQWVALHPKTYEIIASGSSLHEAEEAAVARGVSTPVLFPVPHSTAFFVGLDKVSAPATR
ncbi:MAG: hypothetical protein KY476_12745 [Planctomycetes bacterium]|nr:hypothetical protein [Planctomycetota bacterium]